MENEFTTLSGIPVKNFYDPSDIEGTDYSRDLGVPGSPPYTRGIYPEMYRHQPWMVLQLSGFETAERARERMELLFKEGYRGYEKFGISSFNLVPDVLSTSAAIDPDDPLARGLVGRCGASLASTQDIGYFLHDLPLEQLHLSIISHCSAPAMYPLWIAYADSIGFPIEKLRGDIVGCMDEGFLQGRCSFSPEGALRLRADMVKYAVKHTPQINFNFESYQVRDAGADAAQELGFCLSRAIASIEECLRRGLKIDEFASAFTFHTGLHNDFFEEIAKLRVLRRMWTKIIKDRFEAKDPKSYRAKIFVQTSGSTLTWQQPLNNIVRGTLQGLAAVLGGANALSVDCYDEAYSIPSEQASKQSLRVHQILLHESNIVNTIDPLGGSYFIESLSNKLEESVWEHIDAVDKVGGGWCQAVRNGYIKGEVEKSAYKYSRQIWDGERTIVGVNKFVEEGESPPMELGHKFEVDEPAIFERLKK
jgi:methylmalonyl-CoA mutase N-terminal domain/subunit